MMCVATVRKQIWVLSSLRLREAQLAIEEHERIKLSQRDRRRVIELLENPPAPMRSCATPPEPYRRGHEPFRPA